MIDYRKREREIPEPKEYIVTYSYFETTYDSDDDGIRIDELLLTWQANCHNEREAREEAKKRLEYEAKTHGTCFGYRVIRVEEKK